MTREDALGVVRNWGYLTSEKKEALETLIPELKKDDRKRIKENCIHFLELQKSHHASTVEIDECIDWLNGLVPPKWLYRLEYKDGTCGLWYNGNGDWCFEQGIGSVEGCKTKDLPMDHDERYKQNGRDWFSSCSRKEDLLHWYSLKDAEELLKKGFIFTRYLATEYHEYENETVFIKETSLVREEIDIFELFGKTNQEFNVGDWLQYRNHEPFLVEEITKQGYVSGEECLPFEWGNEIHLWTINDVRPGDIIVEGSRYVTIYKSPTPNSKTTFRSFCFVDLNSDVFVDEGGDHNIKGSCPATKKQRDLLFQKMKESGYEWDADKKEPKKIIDEKQIKKNLQDNSFRRMFEKNPAWGEEDERIILAISQLLKDCESENGWNCVLSNDREVFFADIENYLQSFKNRTVPLPKQEWSEEDETNASYICAALDCYYRLREERNNTNGQEDLDKARNWLYNKLKSLRPQSQWKPSDEQMNAFDAVLVYNPPCSNECRNHLITLYNDLKKLREG